MIKKYLLGACLLASTFCQAKVERTLINGRQIVFFEEDDVIEWTGITFRCGDIFFPLQNKLNLQDFQLKFQTYVRQNQEFLPAYLNFVQEVNIMPSSQEGRTLFKKSHGKPYFCPSRHFLTWILNWADQHTPEGENEVEAYLKNIIQKAITGDLALVFALYTGNYYEINGTSSFDEVEKIFNELLREDPNVFELS